LICTDVISSSISYLLYSYTCLIVMNFDCTVSHVHLHGVKLGFSYGKKTQTGGVCEQGAEDDLDL
jgi:hypothetical protein